MNTVDSRMRFSKHINLEKNDSNINHKQEEQYVHTVLINTNSLLYDIFVKEKIRVNSNHNYHITKTNNFIVSAVSEDGYIEAIELPKHIFALGVQWHPERMINYDKNAQKIFKKLVAKSLEMTKNSL